MTAHEKMLTIWRKNADLGWEKFLATGDPMWLKMSTDAEDRIRRYRDGV